MEQVTGETYNFTLVNYYSNGTDSISYHSDSESFLGPNPCIASLTLGGTRDFMLRHCNYKANIAPIEKFNLRDGDMVVMRGRTQHDWQHSIPKRAKAEGRINVTFRKGVVPYATKVCQSNGPSADWSRIIWTTTSERDRCIAGLKERWWSRPNSRKVLAWTCKPRSDR